MDFFLFLTAGASSKKAYRASDSVSCRTDNKDCHQRNNDLHHIAHLRLLAGVFLFVPVGFQVSCIVIVIVVTIVIVIVVSVIVLIVVSVVIIILVIILILKFPSV